MAPDNSLRDDFLSDLKMSAASTGSMAEVLEVLDAFCAAIQDYANNRVRCARVPGFVTNLGQEYRIVLAPATGSLEHILLRAHVPGAGLPVNLDLYDEDLERCDTKEDLQKALRSFLQRENTNDVINVMAHQSGTVT